MTLPAPEFMPVLSAGAHEDPSQGACIMEYASILAGEKFSDTPACSNYGVAYTAQLVNDMLLDNDRHLILAYLPRIMGTSIDSPALEERVDKAMISLREQWMESMRLKHAGPSQSNSLLYTFWSIATRVSTSEYLCLLEDALNLFDKMTGRTPADYQTITTNDYKKLREAVTA